MRTIIGFAILVSALALDAQSFRGLDRSPLDFAYYPDNYPHDRIEGEEAIIRVIYSRPQKNNREIFGVKVPYGEIWRTGANEATEIKLYKNITIGGKSLTAGSYSLFSIPGESEWTIIFNSEMDYWGSYSYDKNKDVIRIIASSSKTDQSVEAFTIQFQAKGSNGAIMKLAWDDTVVEVPFTF